MENSYLVLLTLLLSAFFSGMEIAFVTANKLRIELLAKKGSMSGKIYSYFLKHPSKFIGCMLVGNNIALVIYGITMAKIIEPGLAIYLNEFGVVLFQTIIATIIVLVTAEFIPKTLFRINPNQVLSIFTIRSEEHTSELQSRRKLVCRLLLEKKKTQPDIVCRLLLEKKKEESMRMICM